MITKEAIQKDIIDLDHSSTYWATRASSRAAAKTVMEKVYFGLSAGVDKVTAAVRPPDGVNPTHFARELMEILRIRYHAQGMAFQGEWVGRDYRVTCVYSENFAASAKRSLKAAHYLAFLNVIPLLGLLSGRDRGSCVTAFFVITASSLLLMALSARKPSV